ncbi:hypothetical protein AALA00_01895 [Lachnospiraceae bacterium 46-15]
MTLTNEDLSAIAQLMDTKLSELDTKFDAKLEKNIQPLRQDIRSLKEEVSELKQDVAELKKEVSLLKQDVAGLKKEVSLLKQKVAGLEKDVSALKQDVSTLKQKVSGLEKDVANLKQGFSHINLHLENVTDKRLQILAENYLPAARRFTEAVSQIEELQNDNKMIKQVLAKHSEILQGFA